MAGNVALGGPEICPYLPLVKDGEALPQGGTQLSLNKLYLQSARCVSVRSARSSALDNICLAAAKAPPWYPIIAKHNFVDIAFEAQSRIATTKPRSQEDSKDQAHR